MDDRAVIKKYPNYIQIYIPKHNLNNSSGEKEKIFINQGYDQDYLKKSIDRTHSTIRDYILCNDFEYFFTLTINPDYCDRTNDKSVQKLLKRYIDKIRRHSSVEYIIVPERHKNGVLHFHGLISNPPPLKKTIYKDRSGRVRYQEENASKIMGFNDWTKIENKDALSQYVRKYITKNMLISPHKKRYYCSRNLKKPEKNYINLRDLPPDIYDNMIELDYAYIGRFSV